MAKVLYVCFLLLLRYSQAVSPTVHTKYGPVKGFTIVTATGTEANIYLGIPFAKPPTGDLRFEKPEQPEKWTESLEAVEYKPGCYPHHRSGLNSDYLSEDCLYLNIMAPRQNINASYAVMLWIHGGGYNVDDGFAASYENITNNFVSRSIVFVTFQYRLGPLGFLSNGDSALSGNLGLWDQTLALQFVKNNIAYFGGDPSRITVIGCSAGAGSASALALSLHSKELFTNAIQLSGSIFRESASGDLVIEASRQLAIHLRCEHENSAIMKSCLKNKTIEELWDAVDKTGKTQKGKMIKFRPRIDGNFFPKNFEALLKAGPAKPSISGLNEKEGLRYTSNPCEDISDLHVLPENFKKYGKENFTDYVKNILVRREDFGDEAGKIQTQIIEHYLGTEYGNDRNYKYWMNKYTQLISDTIYILPTLKEARLKVQNDWPVWLYVNKYFAPEMYSADAPDSGATHATEMPYLFHTFLSSQTRLVSEDLNFHTALLDSFTNFAKRGDPSTDSFKWKKATKELPLQNVRFEPGPVMERTMFEENLQFWTSLESNKYDFVFGKILNSSMASEN